jgi:hypothetical protein
MFLTTQYLLLSQVMQRQTLELMMTPWWLW